MEIARSLREVGLDLLALVWPTECLSCGAPDRDCCDACRADARARDPVLERSVGVPCFAAGTYTGAVRALLIAFKHGGRIGFARELGPRLRAPLIRALAEAHGPATPIVVTAPSRPSRVRERGYRHVDLLVARALRADHDGQPVPPVQRVAALRARRGRTAQIGLDAAQRERNARRVAVRRRYRRLLAGREVIVVDDVVTTGATLRAAIEALEEAGACVVAAVSVCAVARRDALDRHITAPTESPGGIAGPDRGRVPERRNGASEGPPA